MFRAGGDFPPTLAEEHINVQEGYALQQTLRLFCADHPDDIAGSILVSDVDNKVLHDEFKRGRAKNTIMHDTIIIDLFWLQVRHNVFFARPLTLTQTMCRDRGPTVT